MSRAGTKNKTTLKQVKKVAEKSVRNIDELRQELLDFLSSPDGYFGGMMKTQSQKITELTTLVMQLAADKGKTPDVDFLNGEPADSKAQTFTVGELTNFKLEVITEADRMQAFMNALVRAERQTS